MDKQAPKFEKGGKLEKFYALYEAVDTFLYTPSTVTKGPAHVRDVIDLKRIMFLVVIALAPAVVMAMYNTGLQANQVIAAGEGSGIGWRAAAVTGLGLGFNPESILANIVHGALYFLPVYIVTMAVGGAWEVLFAMVRKHEVNEGLLVTGLLFPLILPPTIPLWQVALGISFGVVLGKEVFGGTGMNILNPALVARAFLFFAYPAQISGNAVWVAADGVTQATPLSIAAEGGQEALAQAVTWNEAFMGFMAGSMGETSVVAILIGAIILIVTGIASWRIMASLVATTVVLALLFNYMGSDTNPMFSIRPEWHLVLGGFAFGTVFMATEPVTGSMTTTGKWIYGALIGALVFLVRVVNPAFPEGMMLAILFGNVFAPTIDYFVVRGNIKRRMVRNGS